MSRSGTQARELYSALEAAEADTDGFSSDDSETSWPLSRIFRAVALVALGVCVGCLGTYTLSPANGDAQPAEPWRATPYDSSDEDDRTKNIDENREIGADGIEEDYDSLPGIALPYCQCNGRFKLKDAYRNGARHTAPVLCASPWGDVKSMQYCYPTSREGRCPAMMHKCNNTKPVTPADEPASPCLCAFDIDRTLTAKQENRQYRFKCPNTKAIRSSYDSAFGGGEFTLSSLAALGLNKTACGACYVGIVSHGQATGNKEKDILVEAVMTQPFAELYMNENNTDAKKWSMGSNTWSVGRFGYGPGRIHSPFVIRQGDMEKQWAVEGILEWYASKGVSIDRSRVWFFDDRADNALFFRGTGMNSRQISCGSRDAGGSSCCGYCGARPDEIRLVRGNIDCGTMGNPGTMVPSLHVQRR